MSRDEFIEKLQMVYVGDRNVFNEIVGVYDDLKEQCMAYEQERERVLNKLEWIKENQRLNNVLNELEKFMTEDYNWLDKYGDAPSGCAMGEINRIRKKLKELKESDK